jgi:protein-tyrosine phosphatase
MDEAAFVVLVQEVAQWPEPVYIHCAQGHGRTGTFAAAVLLAKGHGDSVEAAVGQLRAARPRLALGKAQLQFVRRVAGLLLPSGESASTAQAAEPSDRD